MRPSSAQWLLARKPLIGSIERNVLRHGNGALNIDAARLDGGGWPGNLVLSHPAKCTERQCVVHCPVAVLEAQKSGAGRFFYVARPTKDERGRNNTHVAAKPVALMARLIALVTPPGGTILDPFCGTGGTLLSAVLGGWRCIGVERDKRYARIAQRRLAAMLASTR